jgi:hypothetical protein
MLWEFDRECSVRKERDHAKAISRYRASWTKRKQHLVENMLLEKLEQWYTGGLLSRLCPNCWCPLYECYRQRISHHSQNMQKATEGISEIRRHCMFVTRILNWRLTQEFTYLSGSSRGNISWHDTCQISTRAHLGGSAIAASAAMLQCASAWDSPTGCSQKPWRQGFEPQIRIQETAAAVLRGAECFQVCQFLFRKDKIFYRTRAGGRREPITWPEIFLDSHQFYLSIYLSICLPVYLSIYLSINLSTHLPTCLFRSVGPSVSLLLCLSLLYTDHVIHRK